MTAQTKTPAKRTRKPKVKQKLPPNPFMNEILNLVNEQTTKAKKISILKEYETDALKSLLIWNFDPTAITVLPAGDVPFKPNENPLGTDHSSLRREWKNFYLFVKGGNDTLSPIRRESIFIQLLEGLHPDEAKIVCLVKDKKLTDEYKVTKEMVAEAYPDIVWGGRS